MNFIAACRLASSQVVSKETFGRKAMPGPMYLDVQSAEQLAEFRRRIL